MTSSSPTLTALGRDEIGDELKQLAAAIAEFLAILGDADDFDADFVLKTAHKAVAVDRVVIGQNQTDQIVHSTSPKSSTIRNSLP